jgi:hypothetical protein
MRLALLAAAALTLVTPALGRDRTISSRGVRLVVPAPWTRVTPAPDGAVIDPRTLLVVGTHGVHAAPSRCQIAAYRIPASGAVVVVVGWKSLAGSGGQPYRPGRWPLARLRAVHRPSFECFAGRGAAAFLVLAGRAYQVNVLVGGAATRRTVEAALRIARSFDLAR